MDLVDVKRIIWVTAPCRPDGYITADGQQETRDASCYCPENPKGCCIRGHQAFVDPRIVRPDITIFTDSELQEIADYCHQHLEVVYQQYSTTPA